MNKLQLIKMIAEYLTMIVIIATFAGCTCYVWQLPPSTPDLYSRCSDMAKYAPVSDADKKQLMLDCVNKGEKNNASNQ